MDFRSIVVILTDSSHSDLSGISTQTVLSLSGKVIHSQSELGNSPSQSFVIVDDRHMNDLGFNAQKEVKLKIFKNGTLISTLPYIVKTDCCHVGKINGLSEFSLN